MAESRNFDSVDHETPYNGCVWTEFNGESNWFLKGKRVSAEEYWESHLNPEKVFKTCEKCRFFKIGIVMGECRKHSPGANRLWPITHKEDWCGDWEKP